MLTAEDMSWLLHFVRKEQPSRLASQTLYLLFLQAGIQWGDHLVLMKASEPLPGTCSHLCYMWDRPINCLHCIRCCRKAGWFVRSRMSKHSSCVQLMLLAGGSKCTGCFQTIDPILGGCYPFGIDRLCKHCSTLAGCEDGGASSSIVGRYVSIKQDDGSISYDCVIFPYSAEAALELKLPQACYSLSKQPHQRFTFAHFTCPRKVEQTIKYEVPTRLLGVDQFHEV